MTSHSSNLAHAVNPRNIDDWKRSDAYHNDRLIKPDSDFDNINDGAQKEGVPAIAVSRAQGKFLNLLLKSVRAKKVLEVGTLAGYSSIWMAKALPEDGRLVTLELDPKHAKIAEANHAAANLSHKVQVIVGPAVETLADIKEDESFDMAFVDADKPNILHYWKHAKRLVRSGGVIIVDNVVRGGQVANPEYSDPAVEGVRTFIDYMKTDNEVEATTIATVGEKGYDGFLYAYKL